MRSRGDCFLLITAFSFFAAGSLVRLSQAQAASCVVSGLERTSASLLKKGIDPKTIRFEQKTATSTTWHVSATHRNVEIGSVELLNVSATEGRKAARIELVAAKEGAESTGLGRTLYLAAAQHAWKKWGVVLESSDILSSSAADLWERLVRDGLAESVKIQGQEIYRIKRSALQSGELVPAYEFVVGRGR